MILCNLKLQNFKRYKEFELEFVEGLTGFVGRNGSGKSTIFDAVFFALYGDLRSKNAKSHVRNANSDDKSIVLVELIFEINAMQYKVIREFRGKDLVAKAYLYDSSEKLLANGSKEVDKRVQSLIGMEKKAFLNTVFASQKELTSLSQLDNENRKKLIRKLLGLEKIDAVEKKILEKLTDLKRDTKSFIELLLKDDDEKDIRENIEKIISELKNSQISIDKTNVEYKNISNKYKSIYKEIENFQKQKEYLSLLQKELSLSEQKITNNNQNIGKLSKELNELKIKQKLYKEKQGIKEIFSELELSLKEQDKQKENSLLQDGLLKEQKRLRVEFKRTREEIYDLNIQIKDMPLHNKQLEDLKIQIDNVNQSIQELQKHEKTYADEISGLNSLIKQHEDKITNLRRIGRDSECPTCTRPLLSEYDNVLKMLNEEINSVYSTKIKELNEKYKIEVEKKKKTIDYKDGLEKNKNDLFTLVKLLEDKLKRLETQKNILSEIEKVGRKNNEDLSKLNDIRYDRVLHNSLMEQYNVTRKEYESVLKLEESIKGIEKLKKDLMQLQDNEVKFTEEKLSLLHAIKEDKYDGNIHTIKEKEYNNCAAKKEEVQIKLREDEKQHERINGDLKALNEQIKINDKYKLKLKDKENDINDYKKLKVNLNEFKTKINSKIAPRISQIASLMYSNITKGKYQHIEVSNDFDFNIYDNGKSYPIERFSGGEIDLANLVLRIAISKTLSELNGAKQVGFLAFDEVFGSQDENRRHEIMQAFLTIKEEYRQIFLISHEAEVKELFEYFVEIK